MTDQALRITPVYDLLLRGTTTTPVGLYQLQLATAEQLCRLHYKAGTLTTVKARLKHLTDHGYIQADAIPTKRARSPYYYSLGQKGIHYLEESGWDTSATFRSDRETNKHALFIGHTLELNDVLIAAALLQRTDPRYQLESFVHERVLKRRPYKTAWQGRTLTLIPDAFLNLRLGKADGTEVRKSLLLEHDRGTGEQHYFRRKVRTYILLLKEDPTPVLFTTFAGATRLSQMQAWARAELTSSGEPEHIIKRFLFSDLSAPVEPHQLLPIVDFLAV